jgi:hypothetical protein
MLLEREASFKIVVKNEQHKLSLQHKQLETPQSAPAACGTSMMPGTPVLPATSYKNLQPLPQDVIITLKSAKWTKKTKHFFFGIY